MTFMDVYRKNGYTTEFSNSFESTPSSKISVN